MQKRRRRLKNARIKRLKQRELAAEDGTALAYASALDLNPSEKLGRQRWMNRRLRNG